VVTGIEPTTSGLLDHSDNQAPYESRNNTDFSQRNITVMMLLMIFFCFMLFVQMFSLFGSQFVNNVGSYNVVTNHARI